MTREEKRTLRGGLRSRQVRGERHLSLFEPARDFTNPAGHQLEERTLVALRSQPAESLIQHPGHLVEVVPRLINNRGHASKERQRSGEDGQGAGFWVLRHMGALTQAARAGTSADGPGRSSGGAWSSARRAAARIGDRPTSGPRASSGEVWVPPEAWASSAAYQPGPVMPSFARGGGTTRIDWGAGPCPTTNSRAMGPRPARTSAPHVEADKPRLKIRYGRSRDHPLVRAGFSVGHPGQL